MSTTIASASALRHLRAAGVSFRGGLSCLPRAAATSAAAATQLLLNNEVAIITGSGQGIGEATAKLFAAAGSLVVVSDLDRSKSDAVAHAIREAGGDAISVPGDVTDAQFPAYLIEKAMQKYGRINHVVNNAGFTADSMLHKISDEQFDMMYRVHALAPFRIIRAAATSMRIKDGAKRSIVNVSSTSGIHGNIGQANYATFKAGVVGLTKTIAKEWGGFGVRANCVAFGLIETRLTRAKENGEFIEVNGAKVSDGSPRVNLKE